MPGATGTSFAGKWEDRRLYRHRWQKLSNGLVELVFWDNWLPGHSCRAGMDHSHEVWISLKSRIILSPISCFTTTPCVVQVQVQ
eukprot:COSAG02_NODE_52248_length_309_cov_0.600000_1_plen_83_part_10